jgi:putative hydrolase of the HAD superfamily
MDILYDIGRVLLDFNFESSLAQLLPDGESHARLEKLLARKDDFEAGKIETDVYTSWALDVLGSKASHDEFHQHWQEIFTPNEPMWRCVRKLAKDGHRLILFSNTNAIHCPWVFRRYPEFSLFHEAVLSFEVGAIKPHPPIYQHAINAYSLDPASTLYIDDLPENIATGRRFGFLCHQYDLKNHAAFERWLSDHLQSRTSP